MNYFSNLKLASLLISLFLVSGITFANECFDKSPNWLKLDDEYFNLEKSKSLSAQDISALNTLFNNVDGKWEGEIKITECSGPENNPTKNVYTTGVESDIQSSSNGALIINAEIVNPQNKTTTLKNLKLFDQAMIFDFMIKNNNISSSEKFRLKNTNRGSRLIEHVFQIHRQGNSFSMELSFYINGVFTGKEEWSMTGK